MADPDAEMQPTLDSTGSFDNSLGEDSLVAAAAAAEDNYIESDVNDNDQETEDASKKDKDSDYEAKSSDEEADKDEDEDEPKPGTSSEHQSPASNSDGSDSDVPVLSKRSKREEHRKLMEAAGVLRKSGRQRKEVERFAMKASSDDDRKGKRNRRRGSDKSEDSDGGGSSDGSEYRGSSRKRSKGRDVKRKPKRNQRRRRRGDSSDEGWSSSSGEPKRAVRARTGLEQKKPDYREDSSEGAVDSDDVLEWNEEPAASEDAEQVETIEKVLKHRTGRFGATGHATTRYNVEDRGDPNDGFHPDTDTPQTHYFIKWLNWSHVHNTWEAEDTLRKNKVKGLKKLENYIAKSREVDDWKSSVDKDSVEYYDCEQEMAQELYEQHMIPERIIAESRDEAKEDGNMEYLVKWQGLPYADSTWEDESLVKRWGQDKLDEFQQRSKSLKIPTKLSRALRQRPKFKPFKEQPEFLAEGRPEMQLRDYQLDGLNWLLRAWSKSNSCILADEMGLGKTIQSISFLSALANEHDLYGPFLVVVPLSTLAAWGREFEQWAPDLNVIVYIGDVRSREMIREHEWFLPASRRLKFNCCLTTYEILLKDKAFLGGVEWAGLMVDEAHRLKNDESLLYRSLSEFHTDHRVLVTGTPLQNSLKELWALLHFIMPNLFEAWEDFEERHKSSETSAYQTLHQELEPFLLRRVKKDVEKSLPAKVEQILRVDMTALQKQYYKWILTKNYQALSKGVKGSISGFLNIVMELKKCCNHAYLTRPPEVEPAQPQQRLQGLKKASGKLILLDKLLCQLKETGHRVLIFSQMVMLLDILQEYLQLKKFSYQRLDGTMRGELRKQALDHFNGEGSTDFCFLLSTKAGGLGINLATADTVIIFDSDWNPQNDLQAQSRAHRIGQKRQVNIYRLVTKGTVEEDIVERAKQKLVLDHLVIQRMDTTGRTVLSKKPVGSATPFNKDELSSILKFGAEELFKEGEGEEEEPEVDIEEIMQRAETRETEPSNKQADDLLSAFKVTNFAYDEKTEVGSQRGWEDIIPEAERERIAEEERKVVLNPLAPRARRKVLANSDDNDEEWAPGNSGKKRKRNEDRDSSDSEDDDKRRGGKRQKTAIFNFSEPEVKRFLRSYKKFAHVHKRLEAIAGDAGLEDKSVKELQELCDALDRSFKTAVIKYNQAQQNKDPQSEKKDKGPVFKFGGVEVNLRTLLRPHLDLDPLYQIMPSTPESRKHFTLTTTPRSVKLWDVEWGVEDDCALLRGIYEYGLGSWEAIKMDPQLLLAHKILLPEKTKKPQGKHLQSRADYLLKLIKKQELPSTGDDVVVPGIDPEVVAALIDKPGAKKVARRPPPVATAKEKEKVGNETKEENSGGTVPKKKPRGRKPRSPEGEENKSKHKPKAEEEKKPSEKGVNTEKFEVKEKFTHDLDKQDGKTFKICIDRMKKVQKYIKKMKAAAAPSDFNQSLLKIGDHIQECLSNDTIKDKDLEKWHSYLWLFVGKFFENLNGPKLCQFYRNMKVKPADKQAKPDPDHKLDHHDHGKSHSKQHQASGQHRNRHDHSSHDSRRSHKGSERNSSPWDRSRYEDPRYRKESSHRSSYNQAPNSHSRYGHGRGDEDSSNQSPPHSRHYQR